LLHIRVIKLETKKERKDKSLLCLVRANEKSSPDVTEALNPKIRLRRRVHKNEKAQLLLFATF
jgi:hypothetical protein